MDIKDRIAKLLALAESPNQNEAESAMLKARQLMIEHKLTLVDFAAKPAAKVIRLPTDITCSKRRNAWAVSLASVIARNYCCRSYIIRYKGRQTVNIALIGYEEDAQVCLAVLKYALKCIDAWVYSVKSLCKNLYSSDDMRAICDSYARGFTRGIEAAYKRQSDEHQEWGLVLSIPQEARDIVDSFKKEVFTGTSGTVTNMYNQGFSDGAKFEPSTRLEAGRATAK